VCRWPVLVIFVTSRTDDLIGEPPPCPSLVIRKPVGPHTLETAVRRMLGGASALHETLSGKSA
jgi:hypothetical protein